MLWSLCMPLSSGSRKNANVENAVRELNITFAVPIDSNHRIWQAFSNEYWPADYFIDGKGRIRYHHFGEGEYDKSEHVIQELLRENGATGLDASTVRISADGAEAPPSDDLRSPETYYSGMPAPKALCFRKLPARSAFRFHSRDLHMVLAPPKNGKAVRFRVKLDGATPGEDHGVDCNADGAGEIRQPRMYQLIRQKGRERDEVQ
jgi:Thioredoxin like C-terminal domain